MFALIPHVVRRLDLNEANIRSVDIGTQNVVEVRHTFEGSRNGSADDNGSERLAKHGGSGAGAESSGSCARGWELQCCSTGLGGGDTGGEHSPFGNWSGISAIHQGWGERVWPGGAEP